MTIFVRRNAMVALTAGLLSATILGPGLGGGTASRAQGPSAAPSPPPPAVQPIKPPTEPAPQSTSSQSRTEDAGTPVAAEAETKPVTDPIVQATLRVIEAQRTAGPLVSERDLIDALVKLYSDKNQPFWTSTSGYLPRAQKVLDELRAADDWGLSSSAFHVVTLVPGETNLEAIGAAELSLSINVLTYAWHARGGRIDPSALSLWLDAKPRPIDVPGLLAQLSASSDPAQVLRQQHPRHPQFELLRQAYLKARGGAPQAAPAPLKTLEPLPSGPVLKPGVSHPHVALVRQRFEDLARSDDPERYDDTLAAAVKSYLRQAGLNGSALIGAKARAAFNAAGRKSAIAKPASNEATAKRILANMERWRWLPDDLGAVHVWNNLPEFETRVVKDGQVVHQERIIIGRPETQTPIFSDAMRVVVFQPDWGVPNSIKIKDLLPKLQDGDEDVLDRKGMRISANGKTVDPGKFNWDKVDIRTISIVQDPGPSNPLGQIKFLFPNKHDVYMHDTPTKHLFNESTRTFSHGCIRVRNPRKLAEVVFGEDQGWAASDVASRLQSSSPVNNRVPLAKRIPVHNVYFTVVASADGGLRTLNDIYGHDKRITAALDGVSAAQIAASDPARKLARDLKEIMGDPSDSIVAAAKPKTTATAQVASAAARAGANITGARSALGGPVVRAVTPPVVAKPSPVSAASRARGGVVRTEDGL